MNARQEPSQRPGPQVHFGPGVRVSLCGRRGPPRATGEVRIERHAATRRYEYVPSPAQFHLPRQADLAPCLLRIPAANGSFGREKTLFLAATEYTKRNVIRRSIRGV